MGELSTSTANQPTAARSPCRHQNPASAPVGCTISSTGAIIASVHPAGLIDPGLCAGSPTGPSPHPSSLSQPLLDTNLIRPASAGLRPPGWFGLHWPACPDWRPLFHCRVTAGCARSGPSSSRPAAPRWPSFGMARTDFAHPPPQSFVTQHASGVRAASCPFPPLHRQPLQSRTKGTNALNAGQQAINPAASLVIVRHALQATVERVMRAACSSKLVNRAGSPCLHQ